MFQWLGVKDPAVRPEEIVDVAIQRGAASAASLHK
jgi:hypothetical protein